MNYTVFGKHLIDQKTIDQFEAAMAAPFARRGALMADGHYGYSMPIGGVIECEGYIVPAWVGYDIGCGMCAAKTSFARTDIEHYAKEIFHDIYRSVPTGFRHHSKIQPHTEIHSKPTDWLAKMYEQTKGNEQIGTLGSGNHFIEIGYDKENVIWVIVHSGSRNVGHTAATHYMKIASGTGKAAEGNHGLRIDSEEGQNYLNDMEFCLEFALANRMAIITAIRTTIQQFMPGHILYSNEFINRNHNHATPRDGMWIHRKGATHAEAGMLGVIPGNMRDGCYIVRGKGNPKSLYSSSHGAGRVMGRKEAERSLSMDTFNLQMAGVMAKVEKGTLDESPDAYKDIDSVILMQDELLDVINVVRPIINIKA